MAGRLGTLALIAAAGANAEGATLDLTISSGHVSLAATLALPDGPGPFPGVVLMGGSGPSTRADLQPMAGQLVSRGWAVLTYDKRGCGASSGDWTAASLSELSDDSVAALDAMAGRPEVKRDRMGLWGVSQSGWIGPIAASRTDAARFLVVFTGGGATPRQVETYGYRGRLERASLSKEQSVKAQQALDAYFHYLATGVGRTSLLGVLKEPANRPWAAALGLERVLPNEGGRRAWEWAATYEPASDIGRLKIPTFVLLGGRDDQTPLLESFVAWNEGLRKAGDPRSRVLVVPSAGHGMTLGGHRLGAAPRDYAPGVFDAVIAWASMETGSVALSSRPPVSPPAPLAAPATGDAARGRSR